VRGPEVSDTSDAMFSRPRVGRLDYPYPTKEALLAAISISNTTSSGTSSK
jgi:hypothetical protein